VQRGEEILERGREAGVGIGQQVVDLRELCVQGGLVARLRLRLGDLGVQELAVDAHHGIDLHALAEEAAPRAQRVRGALDDALAVVAFGVGVGDVVPARDQAGLRGGKPTDTYPEYSVSHGFLYLIRRLLLTSPAAENLSRQPLENPHRLDISRAGSPAMWGC
jgi:hypothetical protein